jgi:alpha-glucosidase
VPGSPERELYISGTVLTPNGSTPPDNWPAMFGAGAWERASNLDGSPGQWYLHLFALSSRTGTGKTKSVHARTGSPRAA